MFQTFLRASQSITQVKFYYTMLFMSPQLILRKVVMSTFNSLVQLGVSIYAVIE